MDKQPKYKAQFYRNGWCFIDPITGNNKRELYKRARDAGFAHSGEVLRVVVWAEEDEPKAPDYCDAPYYLIDKTIYCKGW